MIRLEPIVSSLQSSSGQKFQNPQHYIKESSPKYITIHQGDNLASQDNTISDNSKHLWGEIKDPDLHKQCLPLTVPLQWNNILENLPLDDRLGISESNLNNSGSDTSRNLTNKSTGVTEYSLQKSPVNFSFEEKQCPSASVVLLEVRTNMTKSIKRQTHPFKINKEYI